MSPTINSEKDDRDVVLVEHFSRLTNRLKRLVDVKLHANFG